MLTSSQLAVGVASVASLVRKLLAQLAKDGLVTGVAGRSGGVRLARPASEITLAEIYRSVMQGGPLWSARKDIPHRCIVSTHMDDFFAKLTSDAETAMLVSLSGRFQTAPNFFSRNAEGGYSFVSKQPETEAEHELCQQALDECPVEAIGKDGDEDEAAAKT